MSEDLLVAENIEVTFGGGEACSARRAARRRC